jgi:hypothetical protein
MKEEVPQSKWFSDLGWMRFILLEGKATTMLYLGIDQRTPQITILLRDECSDNVEALLVPTRPEKICGFIAQL